MKSAENAKIFQKHAKQRNSLGNEMLMFFRYTPYVFFTSLHVLTFSHIQIVMSILTCLFRVNFELSNYFSTKYWDGEKKTCRKFFNIIFTTWYTTEKYPLPSIAVFIINTWTIFIFLISDIQGATVLSAWQFVIETK